MNRFSALTRKITVPHVFTAIFLLLLPAICLACVHIALL